MQKEDIEHMERIIATHKVRYEYLDSTFKDDVVGTIVYVPFNFTRLFQDLANFELNLQDTVNFDMHCAIGIMNLFAHYKHYYLTRKADKVIMIGYVKDKYTYTQHEDLIRMITSICDYFPNVYFMSPMGNIPTVISVHAMLKCIHNTTITQSKPIIHVYSVHTVDKQLLTAFPAKSAFKICKGYTGQLDILAKEDFIKGIFKSSTYYDETMYKSEIERLIVPIGLYFSTYNCASSFDKDKCPVTFVRKHLKNKVVLLNDFLTTRYDSKSMIKNISEQFYDFLCETELANPESLKNFFEYERRHDYHFQDTGFLAKFVVPLFETWSKKIKDYAMHQESENFKMLVKHQLYANWLL